MSLMKLDIPAGIYSHGTDYQSSARWHDANFVRWEGNSIRPIGGWQERVASATASPPRGAISWVENTNNYAHLAVGTYNKLYAITQGGTVSDITPVGLTAGHVDAVEFLGYSGTYFGTGLYGVERPSTGVFQECTTWALDNWGEYLVACSVDDGYIYQWNLTGVATVLSNAPTAKSIVATSERFLFALAASGDPRKVAWSDKEDNNTWTASATNEAGDILLQTPGQIMCGVNTRGRTLILTTVDAHAATYQGPPFVYGFERVGTACGVISRKAAAQVGEGAYWMGRNSFFNFNGSVVQPMPCDVSDHVFKDINRAQMSKVFAVHNSRFNEVWWFYPSSDSMENNRYVAYDYKENHWIIGELDRTTGFDAGVLSRPVLFSSSGDAYNHEVGNYYGGVQPYVESGPINLGNGDQVMHVTQMIPDELVQGEVTATFKTRFYPNDTERSYGPYSMANPTSMRFTGRQVRMRLTGLEYKDWRAGTMRIDVVPGGKR